MVSPESAPIASVGGETVHGTSAFISDLHLGTSGCRAERLLDFLQHLSVDNLFLVGDVIDLERMQQVVHWPQVHTEVMQQVFAMVRQGTRVTYIPGNHDARLRTFAGSNFQGVDIRLNTIHETRQGKRLLITHGDQFDAELKIGSLKEKLGSAAYQWLLDFDAGINKVRERFGYEKISVASTLKMRIKSAQQYIRKYEQTAVRHARKRGLDGIVCGHIHKPACFEQDGVGYYNDGDWVEHCTALIEDAQGNLANIRWSTTEPQLKAVRAA